MSVVAWHDAWGAVAAGAVRDGVAALPALPPGPVLDLGSGLGLAWRGLLRLGRPLVAIERDPELVDRSRAEADRLGVELVAGDALEWLADRPLDGFALIWAGEVLWSNYFVSPADVVVRLAEALRPEGRVAVFTANWYSSRFLWGYPALERRLQVANARRWQVRPDGDDTHHEQHVAWMRRAGGRDLRVSLHPLVGHAGVASWPAWRAYLEAGVWPDYLASATECNAADVALLDRLLSPDSASYLPDTPGYLVMQPAMTVSARW
jgi:SAM-dependent methyltransferase